MNGAWCVTVHTVCECIYELHLSSCSSGPNGNESKQPIYPGFERDILKTVGDYFQRLKEPLLTYHLYEVFVNILSECFTMWVHVWHLCTATDKKLLVFILFSLYVWPSVAGLISPLISAGLLQEQEVATEALQVSCLLLPPPNRRRLQLLLRLMSRVCQNPHLPPLNDAIATRTLVPFFASCVCVTSLVFWGQIRLGSEISMIRTQCNEQL